jgi:hypothetical protein
MIEAERYSFTSAADDYFLLDEAGFLKLKNVIGTQHTADCE